MKHRISVMLVAVVSVATLFLIGHTVLTMQRQSSIASPPVGNAKTVYAEAVSKIDLSEDLILTIQLTEEMIVDGSIFLETAYRTVHYDMQASGAPYIQRQETRHSGTHIIELSEIFANNTVYLTVNDTPFSGLCDAEQYESSQIPAIILSPNLYRKISAIDTGSGYMITFSEPVGAEAWLTDLTATLTEARGVAYVDYNGELESSMYTASYQHDDVTFNITAQVDINVESVNVTPPDDLSVYTPIADWQAPTQLERACGYLVQAKQISAIYNDNIYFEAIGDRREKRVALHAYFDDEWSVSVATNITTKNETKLNQELTLRKNEIFLDGLYRISNNEEIPTSNTSITVDTVYNYFQDQLVSTAILPQHIRSAEITENGNVIHVTFEGTDAFGYFLAESACQLLYNDPNLITETSSVFTVLDLNSYLDIDRTTGLPLASGIDFTGSYIVEDIPYLLEYRADQTYSIPSLEAETEIQKAAD